MPNQTIIINMQGRFQVTGPDGEDLTPVGNKVQAVIALLATESKMKRGRCWLQDKLWSDRGPEQGAASLRQALHHIRRSLGKYQDVLQSSRLNVALDQNRVCIADEADGEFLEGLDVRDPEFSEWLAMYRNRGTAAPASPPRNNTSKPMDRRRIVVQGDADPGDTVYPMERAFIEHALRSIRETQVVDIGLLRGGVPEPDAIVVSVKVYGTKENGFSVQVVAEDFLSNAMIWSDSVHGSPSARTNELPVRALAMCNRLMEALDDAVSLKLLPRQFDTNANMLANLGVRKLFAVNENDVLLAETLLRQAIDIEPRGVYFAWLAQVLVIRRVERYSHDRDALQEEADALCARALALDPTNSNVLAAVANARAMIDGDVVAARELSQLAVKANISNPLGWWALSNALQYSGDHEDAYCAAVNAQQLAENTRLKFWTDIQRGLAASALKRTKEALRFAELSSVLSPNFRPPLRYLIALYAAEAADERVEKLVTRLMQRESGFSLERMRDDSDYPVGLMRLTGLNSTLSRYI